MHQSQKAQATLKGLRAAHEASIVPGQGSGDKVPAMLEPQEAVLPRKTVHALGGPNAVAQMIHQTTGTPPARGLRAGAGYAGGVAPIDPYKKVLGGVDLNLGGAEPAPALQPQAAPQPTPQAAPQSRFKVTPANADVAATQRASNASFDQAARDFRQGPSVAQPPQATTPVAEAPGGNPISRGVQSAKNWWRGGPQLAPEPVAPTAPTGGGVRGKIGGFAKTGLFVPAMVESVNAANNMSNETYGKGLVGAGVDGVKDIVGGGGLLNNLKLGAQEVGSRMGFGATTGDSRIDNYNWKEGVRANTQQAQNPSPTQTSQTTPDQASAVAQPSAPNTVALRDAQGNTTYSNQGPGAVPPNARVLDGQQFGGKNISVVGYNSPLAESLGYDKEGNKAPQEAYQKAIADYKSAEDRNDLNGMSAARMGLKAALNVRGQDFALQGHQMQRGIAQAQFGLAARKDGAEMLEKMTKNNIHAQVPEFKDGKPTGARVNDAGQAAELDRYISDANEVVNLPDGRAVSLAEAGAHDYGSTKQAHSMLAAEYGMGQLANNYSKNTFFGKQAGVGRLRVKDVRPIQTSDFANGVSAWDTFASQGKPGSYGNGVEIDAGNGRTQVIPMSEIANHPDAANMLAVINRQRAEQRKPPVSYDMKGDK